MGDYTPRMVAKALAVGMLVLMVVTAGVAFFLFFGIWALIAMFATPA